MPNAGSFVQLKTLMWWSPLAAAPITMRCGWKAVADMGEPRFCPRKLEYGSERESSLPWKLNTLTMWAEVPLQVEISVLHIHKRVGNLPGRREGGGGRGDTVTEIWSVTYTEKTGKCSWTLAVLRTSFVVWNTFSG